MSMTSMSTTDSARAPLATYSMHPIRIRTSHLISSHLMSTVCLEPWLARR